MAGVLDAQAGQPRVPKKEVITLEGAVLRRFRVLRGVVPSPGGGILYFAPIYTELPECDAFGFTTAVRLRGTKRMRVERGMLDFRPRPE